MAERGQSFQRILAHYFPGTSLNEYGSRIATRATSHFRVNYPQTDNTIELQPINLLKQPRILETTLRHELVHVLIETIGGGNLPRWLTEGMAIYVAGEGRLMDRQTISMSPPTVEQALTSAKSAAEMRTAYAAAYNLVKQLIRSEGENKVWKKLADRSYSVKATVVPTLFA